MRPPFLTLEELLAIHAHQIERYGGAPGIRDRRLLESARNMAEATFGGDYLHATVHEQAAAYLFHLVKNHPFVDGNKRAGLACCLVFLGLSGIRITATDDEIVGLVLGVIDGSVSKSDVAVFLRERSVVSD